MKIVKSKLITCEIYLKFSKVFRYNNYMTISFIQTPYLSCFKNRDIIY